MDLGLLQNIDIERQALLLLFMIPVVVTIVGITRHIVGIKSLGIYATVILTFAFYGLGLNGDYAANTNIFNGVRYGLSFLVVLIAATVLGSTILKSSRMHYFPKVAMVMSFAAVGLILALILGDLILGDLLGRKAFSSINALALVMIASVAEQFTSTLFKLKWRKAILLTAETTFTALICYLLIAWPAFQDLVINYPYVLLLTFLINYLVGKYRGLRILEFIRFREVLKNADPD